MELEAISEYIIQRFPEYKSRIKKILGRDYLEVEKTSKIGIQIFSWNNTIQILPIAPTFIGRLKTNNKTGVDDLNIEFVNEIYKDFQLKFTDDKVEVINDQNQILASDKSKKTDTIAELVVGVMCIGLSIFLYSEFSNMEASNGEMEINWIIAMLYNLFGKKVACFLILLIGVLFSFFSIKKLIKK